MSTQRIALTALGTAAISASAAVAQSVAPDPGIPVQKASDPGAVRAVTLYPDRAAVTRAIRLDLAQGVWMVRVPGLPAAVVPTSIQAKVLPAAGASAPRLLGVEYASEPRVAFSSSPEGIALAERVKELRRQLVHLAQDRALLEQQEKLVDQIGVRPTATGGPEGTVQPIDTAAAARQLAAVRAEKARLLEESRGQDDRRQGLERELAAAESRLASRGGADREERSGVLSLAVPQSGAFEVELTYLVRDAAWSPAYSVRAAGDRTGISVEYDALVTQRTGEDWRDVRLALSTAQPTGASAPPPVEPWYVDVRMPPPPPPPTSGEMPAAVAAPAAPMESGMMTGAPKDASNERLERALEDLAAPANVAQAGVAVSFELPRPVTIVSDAAGRQRTRIGAFTPEVRFTYVAAPILSESVFLRGDMVNASAFQLLPGRAQVFMGGDFVGDADMPSVAPNGDFRLYFGPDRALRARREVLSKVTGASGLFGGSTVTTWNDRITVDNGTGRDVRVEVYDRRPVSRNERIEVRASAITPALSTDAAYVEGRLTQGILRWDLAVPASARGAKAAAVTWSVEVARPNDLPITPVPD